MITNFIDDTFGRVLATGDKDFIQENSHNNPQKQCLGKGKSKKAAKTKRHEAIQMDVILHNWKTLRIDIQLLKKKYFLKKVNIYLSN